MLKIASIGCLVVFFLNVLNVNSQCTTTLTCINYGVFNSTTCVCDCYTGFYGNVCQYVNCQQPAYSMCTTVLTVDTCVADFPYRICPSMCNNPICTCGFSQCLNNGTFDIENCTCQCAPGFFGTTCESTSSTFSLVCASPGTNVCLNSGRFNLTTCLCDCIYI
jgi:hypothetical protein